MGKGKDGQPTDMDQVPKSYILLERISEEIKSYTEESVPHAFEVKAGSATTDFAAPSVQKMEEWVKWMNGAVEQIKAVPPRETVDETNKKLNKVREIFQEKSFSISNRPSPIVADRWVTDYKKFKEGFRTWSPFIYSLGLFAEFQIGRMKSYQTFFTDRAHGVESILNHAEEDVLAYWEGIITQCSTEIENAMETMFFKEDLSATIDNSKRMLELIQIYNSFKKDIHTDNTVYFGQETENITQLLQELQSYPLSGEVSVEGYSSGKMISDEEMWHYNNETVSLACADSPFLINFAEKPEFFSQGNAFQMVNNLYGIILWNGKSWIWTHPKCPFLLRYDWYESKGVFRQKIRTPRRTNRQSNIGPSASFRLAIVFWNHAGSCCWK